jgi:hypothetical protein
VQVDMAARRAGQRALHPQVRVAVWCR